MAETVVIEETVEETAGLLDNVIDVAHKAFQVSLGAVVAVQDGVVDQLGKTQKRVTSYLEQTQKDAGQLVGNLEQRGAKVEKKGVTKFNEFMESRKKQVDETINTATVQVDVEGRIANVLKGMNVPTKADIEALNKKIDALTKKIEALAK